MLFGDGMNGPLLAPWPSTKDNRSPTTWPFIPSPNSILSPKWLHFLSPRRTPYRGRRPQELPIFRRDFASNLRIARSRRTAIRLLVIGQHPVRWPHPVVTDPVVRPR